MPPLPQQASTVGFRQVPQGTRQASEMRKADSVRPVRDERIANLERRGPAEPGDIHREWVSKRITLPTRLTTLGTLVELASTGPPPWFFVAVRR